MAVMEPINIAKCIHVLSDHKKRCEGVFFDCYVGPPEADNSNQHVCGKRNKNDPAAQQTQNKSFGGFVGVPAVSLRLKAKLLKM